MINVGDVLKHKGLRGEEHVVTGYVYWRNRKYFHVTTEAGSREYPEDLMKYYFEVENEEEASV
jgi:hypothetical protein